MRFLECFLHTKNTHHPLILSTDNIKDKKSLRLKDSKERERLEKRIVFCRWSGKEGRKSATTLGRREIQTELLGLTNQ